MANIISSAFEARRDKKALEAATAGNIEDVKYYIGKGLSDAGYNNVALAAFEQKQFAVLQALDATKISQENRDKLAPQLVAAMQFDTVLAFDAAGLTQGVHDAAALAIALFGRWTEAAVLTNKGVSDETYNALVLAMVEQKEWKLLQPVNLDRLATYAADKIVMAAASETDPWILQWAVGTLNDKLSIEARSAVALTAAAKNDWPTAIKFSAKGISDEALNGVAAAALVTKQDKPLWDVWSLGHSRLSLDNRSAIALAAVENHVGLAMMAVEAGVTPETRDALVKSLAVAGEWPAVKVLAETGITVGDEIALAAVEKGQWWGVIDALSDKVSETTRNEVAGKAADAGQWDTVAGFIDQGISDEVYNRIAVAAMNQKEWNVVRSLKEGRLTTETRDDIAVEAVRQDQFDIVSIFNAAGLGEEKRSAIAEYAASEKGELALALELAQAGVDTEALNVLAGAAGIKGEWNIVKAVAGKGLDKGVLDTLAAGAAQTTEGGEALGVVLKAGLSNQGLKDALKASIVSGHKTNVIQTLHALETRFAHSRRGLRQAFSESVASLRAGDINAEVTFFLREAGYLASPVESRAVEGMRVLEDVIQDGVAVATSPEAADAAGQVVDQVRREVRKVAGAVIRQIFK